MFQKKKKKKSKWYRSRFDRLEPIEWVGIKLNWPQRWHVHIVIGYIVIDVTLVTLLFPFLVSISFIYL
jgi:hypothetical protein